MIRRLLIVCSVRLAAIGLSHAQNPPELPGQTSAQQASATTPSNADKGKQKRKEDHKPISAAEALI